ncbi:cupin [Lentzea sp. NBRC 105346]|uniref:cupin domain-containing protein n=1 Tax=Lentzea sp. NBRC 105346 TaxID=3032205 RepID=UPI0024A2EE28|nr:cupin domain-containing protein [Lentzea sp. NBRC 105346]GLZ32172.1 cupin [Lentzea sp. NBRC 105346]
MTLRVLAAALVLALLPATAHATPSRGVTGKILAQKTVGDKDYVLREITITPGGSTGWHYHDGTLYALVKKGTITRTFSDCTTTEVHHAGQSLREPSGADHVHIGRNLGSSDIVLEVLYVLPTGSPLARDAANPGCDFD